MCGFIVVINNWWSQVASSNFVQLFFFLPYSIFRNYNFILKLISFTTFYIHVSENDSFSQIIKVAYDLSRCEVIKITSSKLL